ncbi:radical SAM protein [Candidatus Binatus soli]|jgi:CofH subfamily radical SAM domain protein|uniref:radical SAM protein n=1 Tax=Candidatus Binatus soli TaxID=1953413 RepID=UPI003D1221A5
MIQSTHEDASFKLLDRAIAGHRLSAGEIRRLYDLPTNDLAAAAHELRLRRSNPELATYSIGGNIDYTNICVVACRFCAFYRARHQEGAFTLTLDEIADQMDELRRIGGRDALLEGGINPDLPFQWYLDLLRFLKSRYPEIHIDAFSPEEILGLEKLTGRDAWDILCELKDAGLDGMPGAAAEILVDEVRERTAPTRMKTGDWLRIIDSAMKAGLHNPWVGMVIGFGETLEQRVQHLIALRDQQDRGLERYGCGFSAYKIWPARLEHTRLNGSTPPADNDAVVNEYLRDVAVARLALDNIENHRAVWRTMGFEVASRALRSGANDLCGTGSINAINACITAAGKDLPDPTEALLRDVVKCIEAAGFTAALRDPYYNILTRHESTKLEELPESAVAAGK